MSIPFIQYLRPHGAKRTVTIDRPAEIEALAGELQKAGVVFEIEELSTGVVSMEAVRPSGRLTSTTTRTSSPVSSARTGRRSSAQWTR